MTEKSSQLGFEMRKNESWYELLSKALKENEEAWEDVVFHTLSDADLHQAFDTGFGGSRGKAFTLWTRNRVYFPAVYDGLEWVESVSRHPDGVPTHHVGGE